MRWIAVWRRNFLVWRKLVIASVLSNLADPLILLFGLGYGLCRVLEDFLREDARRLGLTASQWTAIATVLVCLYTLFVRRRTPRWGRWDERAAVAPGPVEEESGSGDAEDGAILSGEDHGPEP